MISFIHRGGRTMASYRYRAEIPARELGASVNDPSADVLVFAKPMPDDACEARRAKARGAHVIVDFCDDHLEAWHYLAMAGLADAITCPTPEMARRIQAATGRAASVIPDPWEFPAAEPHCDGVRLLWFGHASNLSGLARAARSLEGYPLTVVSSAPGALPWSHAEMLRQLAAADIVVLPASAPYKSANRAVEAIRQGCFVVAEPHPALTEIPGIFIGRLREGVEWARSDAAGARSRTREAQRYVTPRFSPEAIARAWRGVCGRLEKAAA
jgi:hypothetical protein